MFLFKREVSPVFGFFILNRNGLEYVNEFLVAESEVKLEGEFILFEPRPDAGKLKSQQNQLPVNRARLLTPI